MGLELNQNTNALELVEQVAVKAEAHVEDALDGHPRRALRLRHVAWLVVLAVLLLLLEFGGERIIIYRPTTGAYGRSDVQPLSNRRGMHPLDAGLRVLPVACAARSLTVLEAKNKVVAAARERVHLAPLVQTVAEHPGEVLHVVDRLEASAAEEHTVGHLQEPEEQHGY